MDRRGHPLQIARFEGNKPETGTIIPVIDAFQKRHQVTDIVVVADAGMLSSANLEAIDQAGLRFIVGSRITKAPHDLATQFPLARYRLHRWADHRDHHLPTRHPRPPPGHVTARTRLGSPRTSERVAGDLAVLPHTRRPGPTHPDRPNQPRHRHHRGPQTSQESPIRQNQWPARHTLDHASLERAQALVGLKGYVTNITADVMPAGQIIASYHDLWHIEQSFRMSKTDLTARPIFHHTRDAIEAHLTIVFAALAIARDLQTRSGVSLKKIIRTVRPLRHATIRIGDHHLEAEPHIPTHAADILTTLGH